MDFTSDDLRSLKKAGFKVEYHPHNLPFAIKKGGYSVTLNDDGSVSAGFDDGQEEDASIKVCGSVKEALKFLSKF